MSSDQPVNCTKSVIGDDDSDDDEFFDRKEGIGGVVRSALRSVMRNKAGLGSFPRPKTMAKGADRLATLIELRDEIVGSTASKTSSDGKLIKAFKSVYGLAKLSVSGYAVFYTYENVCKVTSNYSLAGFFGGVSHGAVAMIFDSVQSALYRSKSITTISVANYIPSNLLFHGVVHSSLFTVYEFSNRFLNDVRKENRRDLIADDKMIDFYCRTGVSGAAAGIAAEVATHILSPMQEYGIVHFIRNMKYLRPPRMITLLKASVPSALGFIAYEYERQL